MYLGKEVKPEYEGDLRVRSTSIMHVNQTSLTGPLIIGTFEKRAPGPRGFSWQNHIFSLLHLDPIHIATPFRKVKRWRYSSPPGGPPYKGMCRQMASYFHDWIDYDGVAFSIGLLDWGHTFSDFGGIKTVLHILGSQSYQNVCTVGEK